MHKNTKEKIKQRIHKTWDFLINDDSFASWIVDIILAFVLIKFIVYPGLGFLMATSHPLVAVISGSMEHKMTHPCIGIDQYGYCNQYDSTVFQICGKRLDEKERIDFDKYWEMCGDWYTTNTQIEKSEFDNFKLKNGFNKGDIIILKGSEIEDIEVGDIIVFNPDINFRISEPIIHRVVNKIEQDGEIIVQTKGDHNSGSNNYENNINEEQIIGKAVFKIPYFGWIKIGFMNLIKLVM